MVFILIIVMKMIQSGLLGDDDVDITLIVIIIITKEKPDVSETFLALVHIGAESPHRGGRR